MTSLLTVSPLATAPAGTRIRLDDLDASAPDFLRAAMDQLRHKLASEPRFHLVSSLEDTDFILTPALAPQQFILSTHRASDSTALWRYTHPLP